MKRVLVTGAAGFVGRHALAPLRARGYDVHAISRRPPPAELRDRATWHAIDLLDRDATRQLVDAVRPSSLLHLAWYTAHGKFWRAAENLEWVEASLALARFFVAAGGHRWLGVGSCAEYSWGDGALDEERTPCRPSTLYGASKYALYLMLDALAATTTLELAWGRLFFLYGPHESPNRLVSSVSRSLLAGDTARCSAGTQRRDFLHAQDAAGGLVALLDSEVTGAVNIASGHAIALRDVIGTLGALAHREDLIELGALPMRAGDPPEIFAETTRLREEVKWTPERSLREGLRDTLEWWRSHDA